MKGSDPRKPIIIGMIALAALMFAGMIWAVVSASTGAVPNGGTYDPNVSFIDEGDPTWGPDDAEVTIRIFEDFECPACETAHRGLRYVMDAYGDRVRLVWNDFPLDASHPDARLASNAARCAEEQGKFWEYGDVLYDSQPEWAGMNNLSEFFITYAKELELNVAAFTVCLDESRYNDKIQNDVKEAQANRVDVTPTFFVNSKRYPGVLTAAQWDAILVPLLKDDAGSQQTSRTEAEDRAGQEEPELIEGAEPIDLNL